VFRRVIAQLTGEVSFAAYSLLFIWLADSMRGSGAGRREKTIFTTNYSIRQKNGFELGGRGWEANAVGG
jgi:hypothetical protein